MNEGESTVIIRVQCMGIDMSILTASAKERAAERTQLQQKVDGLGRAGVGFAGKARGGKAITVHWQRVTRGKAMQCSKEGASDLLSGAGHVGGEA